MYAKGRLSGSKHVTRIRSPIKKIRHVNNRKEEQDV